MRISADYAKEKFRYFNHLCFGDALPEIKIIINNSRRSLGMFVHPGRSAGNPKSRIRECSLKFSQRFDLDQPIIDDTIIHEMIHFYIWYNDLNDTSTHGHIFRHFMKDINLKHSRNITVTHRCSETELNSDTHHRNNFICISRWKNGSTGLTVCARTKIFEIHRLLLGQPDIIHVTWYWSRNPWFNRYPVSRTAKIYHITSETELNANLATATPCEVAGSVFRPKRLS